MIRYMLFFSSFFLFNFLFGQNRIMEGFAVMQTGDTLKGCFQLLSPAEQVDFCCYKANEQDAAWKTYKPYEVAFYRLENGRKVVSKTLNSTGAAKSIFMEHIVDGSLKLYCYSNEDGEHYLVERDSLGLSEVTVKRGDFRIDGQEYTRSSNLHANLLRYYTKECPELLPEIRRIKTVTRENLSQVVMLYNKKMGGENSAELFQKKDIKRHAGIQLLGGLIFIPSVEGLLDRSLPAYGVLVEFNLLRHNPNWNFSTGLLLAKKMRVLNFYDDGIRRFESVEKQPVFLIPLTVQYTSPTSFGYIVGAGLQLTTPSIGSFLNVSGTLGLKYDISKRVGLRLTGYYSYCGEFLVSFKDISKYYGVNMGLNIKLR